MTFRKKLLFVFGGITILLISIISISFYYIMIKRIETSNKENLDIMTDKLVTQFRQTVKPMEFISWDFIADREFVIDMEWLKYMNQELDIDKYEYSQIDTALKSAVHRDSLAQNFYAVNIFNENGNFYSSNYNNIVAHSEIQKIVNDLSWTEEANQNIGRSLLLHSYIDPWNQKHEPVFGLVRALRGQTESIGYIEVQIPLEEFEEIFIMPESEKYKTLVWNDDKTLYSDNFENEARVNQYKKFSDSSNWENGIVINPETNEKELVTKKNVEEWGVTILVVQSYDTLIKSALNIGQGLFLIGGICVLMAIIGMNLFIENITKPIRELKSRMENMELENLPESIDLCHKEDEIEALNKSFQDLRNRLNVSMQHEIEIKSLILQANLDMLQAQINPHFLYNVLNIISNRGIENDDYEIGEICTAIASMLRYTTSTIDKVVTIQKEIEHTEAYLLLMKKRLEDRLSYRVEVSSCIYMIPSTKLILQPIVENSLNHGYKNSIEKIKVLITGGITDNRWWIKVEDWGCGIAPEVLNDIRHKMQEVRKTTFEHKAAVKMTIGGMGVVSVYLRLLLFYGETTEMSINNKEQGVEIVISAELKSI